MVDGRPRGLIFASYREYKRVKRNFHRALGEAHERYMCDVYKDIGEAVEMDIRIFWKLTKRRKRRASRIYSEIQNKKGTTLANPEGEAETFAQYYEKIYILLQDNNFNQDFKYEVEFEIRRLTEICESDIQDLPGGSITTKELNTIINSLKRRKEPGHDSVTNEHIIHGGKSLVTCLVKMYNSIVSYSKTPLLWKQGLIVPLYKGGSKPKNKCDSHRPVALLPSLFKIFEKNYYVPHI